MRKNVRSPINKWTLVRHSGWTVAKKPGFEHAVETQMLTTQTEVARVVRVGGMVFDDYTKATEAEYSENYPPGIKGLIPKTHGTFARAKIQGGQIYQAQSK
jgi:hypothetical protein